MKKFLLLALALPVLLASCSKDGAKAPTEGDGGIGGSIKISSSTNREVDEIFSRAAGDDYWLDVTSDVTGFEPISRLLGSDRMISGLETGSYTVSLRSKNPDDTSFEYPTYNLPIYGGSQTNYVESEGESVAFSILCKQVNTGIRFIFDQTVTSYYKNPVVTITNSDDESLDLTPADQVSGQEKIAYFDPGELTITLNDDKGAIKIGSEYAKDITVSARQLWTITLKTSLESGNSIIVDIDIDEGTDDLDFDWGVGEVTGTGTAAEPFSVNGAINAMPGYNVWVEGYVLGSTTLNLGRSSGLDNIVIGQTKASPIAKGIAIKVDVDQDLLKEFDLDSFDQLLGMRIAIKGNIGRADNFDSPGTIAEMDHVHRWTPNYFSDAGKSVNYYAINTLGRDDVVLKNALPGLPVGACVRHEQLPGNEHEDAVYTALVKREFNSVTAEYSMKMSHIWKDESDYPAGNFADADKTVKFAQENNMRVHGHALIWSQVVPRWLRDKGENEGWDQAKWTEVMETYIKNVTSYYAANYPGVVQSWDVVNEAFSNGDGKLRGIGGPEAADALGNVNSFWYDKVGSDFIEKAFRAARKALDDAGDTGCKLFYNDYGIVSDVNKRDGIYDYFAELLTKTGDDSFPIDGIGMQCHVEVHADGDLAKEGFAKMASLKRAYDNKKLLIHLSELDVLINNLSYIYGNHNGVFFTKWWENAGNPTFWNVDFAQGKSFNVIASAYLDNVPESQQFGITTWGITDRYSMTGMNHHGYPDWSVLFTKANEPKSAYHALLEALLGVNWHDTEVSNGWNWRWEPPGGFAKNPWL